MSDPGTTYRTREEIQNMRSSNDAIQGLKSKLLEWGIVNESELREIDKEARKKVDDEVAQAEKSPERTSPFPPFFSPPPLLPPCPFCFSACVDTERCSRRNAQEFV